MRPALVPEPTEHRIYGTAVDAHGRCAHWATERDVVANQCARCRRYWACSICHEEAMG